MESLQPINLRLDGKTALVTGGASGIGQAIATMFAASGAAVHIVDLNRERCEAAAEAIRNAGSSATAQPCDVSDAAQVARVVSSTAAAGRVDILVNSAGISHIGSLETTTAEDFDRLFRVNVKGVYHCMQAVIGPMVAAGGGVILNLASTAASSGLKDRFAYSMTKGAVLSMTLSVAKDYLEQNIRCNAISPARVHTPFVDGYLRNNYPGREQEMFAVLSRSQPIGRMGEPREVASLALFLCSNEAAFITGCDIPLDGGFFNLRG